MKIRTKKLESKEYEIENVIVRRIPLLKLWPHIAYSDKERKKAIKETIEYCNKNNFIPDIITAHWPNPQLEVMKVLKQEFGARTCFVTHSSQSEILHVYTIEQANKLLEYVDVLGFRSRYIRDCFTNTFNHKGKQFLCFSGIPQQFITSNEGVRRNFSQINKFIYVGTLIKRKFPSVIIPAVKEAMGNENYSISYIGTGAELANIEKMAESLGILDRVHILGRMEREDVVLQLKQHDVFVMISKSEAFGLVYLEAMAVGCIVIAAKNEGFDGIIKHGINGFLCEAGNDKELAKLISYIRTLTENELQKISQKAINTAKELTDVNVAKNYIQILLGCDNEVSKIL